MRFMVVLLGFFAFGCRSSDPTPPADPAQAKTVEKVATPLKKVAAAPKKAEAAPKEETALKKTVTPTPKDTPVTLNTILADKNHILIDVRTPGEFAMGHIPNAVNIPLGQEARMAEAIGDKGRSTVVYCRSGARSGRALSILMGKGFNRIVNGGGASALARGMGVQLTQ